MSYLKLYLINIATYRKEEIHNYGRIFYYNQNKKFVGRLNKLSGKNAF